MYKAFVVDRLKSLDSRQSRFYTTYNQAWGAGYKLYKKHFTESRADILVCHTDSEDYAKIVKKLEDAKNGNGY